MCLEFFSKTFYVAYIRVRVYIHYTDTLYNTLTTLSIAFNVESFAIGVYTTHIRREFSLGIKTELRRLRKRKGSIFVVVVEPLSIRDHYKLFYFILSTLFLNANIYNRNTQKRRRTPNK